MKGQTEQWRYQTRQMHSNQPGSPGCSVGQIWDSYGKVGIGTFP
ncbi:hypothetical protein [Erwinia endophytica]|nr:hypothetical protein [Erwinia endophytica]